jgi:hypothetical protein
MAKRTYREFRQGIFKPLNKAKCLNGSPVIFRSYLEARLFKILDSNPRVLEWSSEETIVPYVHPIKTKQTGQVTYSRYFVDVYMKLQVDEKTTKKYIVEIKPASQVAKPVANNKKKQSTILYENAMYAINTAKWEAATAYAKKKGMDFLIITEKNIDFLEGK